MRVAIVTTYRPRACGIAVFSGDLRRALLESQPLPRRRRRLDRPRYPVGKSAGVVTTIRQDVASDYPAAAKELARRGTDVSWSSTSTASSAARLRFILGLTAESRVPVVVTLHTPVRPVAAAGGHPVRIVPAGGTGDGLHRDRAPDGGRTGLGDGGPGPGRSPRRSDVLNAVAAAWTDRRSLPTAGLTEAANELGLDRLASRTVLSTFGLISASKGLELMIRALPPVVAARPDVLYLIAGQTHPEVVKHEGERLSAGPGAAGPRPRPRRARRVRRSLPVGRRARRPARPHRPLRHALPLAGTDRLRCPHLRRPPAARLSPSCRYAENLLGSGAGVLVPFGDVPRLSAAVLDLLETPASWTRPGSRLGGLERTCLGPAWARSPEVLAEAVHDIGPSARRSGRSRPACRRSGPATCCGWSTTSASSSTPAARCRPARPATASTTWHGWPSWPFSWGRGPTTPPTGASWRPPWPS